MKRKSPPSNATVPAGHRAARLAAAAVLVALTFIVYSNTLSNGFVSDDGFLITGNPWIRSVKNLPEVFTSFTGGFSEANLQQSTYRPMMFVLFIFEYMLFGLNPQGWHLISVVLHASVGVVVFFILSFLLAEYPPRGEAEGPGSPVYLPALLGSAVFASHPVNSEPVAWVSSATELLFTLFVLLAFYIHIRSLSLEKGEKGAGGAGEGGGGGGGSVLFRRVLPALFFLIALFLKETAVVLPVIIFIHDWLKEKRLLSVARTRAYIPYVIAVALYTLIRLFAIGGVTPGSWFHYYLSAAQFALNAVVLFIEGLRMLVFPVGVYPFQILEPVLSISEPRALVSVVLTLSIPVFLFLFRRKIHPLYYLASAIIVLPMLPALYTPAITRFSFAERYLYFSSAGFALFVALVFRWVAGRGPAEKRVGVVLLCLVIAASSIAAARKNLYWRTNLTLAGSALRGSPDNYFALYQIGNELAGLDRYEEAVPRYREAIEIISRQRYPDAEILGFARTALADAYFSTGKTDQALAEYEGLLRTDPENPLLNYQAGYIYQQKGLLDDALFHYREAARRFKGSEDLRDTYLNIGNVYAGKGMPGDARSSYFKALEVSPDDPLVLRNLRLLDEGSRGR